MPNLTKLRSSAYAKQNGFCFYCCLPMWSSSIESFCKKYSLSKGLANRLQCTAEHLKARQDGGGNNKQNIVAACRFCNEARHRAKHAKEPEGFKGHVVKRISKGKWHPKELWSVL